MLNIRKMNRLTEWVKLQSQVQFSSIKKMLQLKDRKQMNYVVLGLTLWLREY